MEALSITANILTIIAFGLTIYVTWVAQTLQKFHNKHQRVPKLIEDIRDYRVALALKIKDPNTTDEQLREGRAICAANLKSLVAKVPRNHKIKIKEILLEIDRIPEKHCREAVDRVHTGLEYIETDIRNWIQDEAIGGMYND
jgi:hypothetical protein